MKHDRDTNTIMSAKTGEKQRLLIVDDSKVIRVTARKILRDHFDTVEAVDGENAWEVLSNEEPFSLVVSDLTMPHLDGFGLLERIRTSHLPHVREVPVIIITGANDSETVKKRATEAGATDFIGKPFDSVLLYDSIRVVTRVLKQIGFSGYHDRTRSAKRRVDEIRNAADEQEQKMCPILSGWERLVNWLPRRLTMKITRSENSGTALSRH